MQADDNYDFESNFQALQNEFRQRFNRDFRITAGAEGYRRMHRKLSGGNARDIGAHDLSSEQRQWIVKRASELGMDVVDQSTPEKRLKGSTGTHIHVGKYLKSAPPSRGNGAMSRPTAGNGQTTSVGGYNELLDSILDDYGVSDAPAQTEQIDQITPERAPVSEPLPPRDLTAQAEPRKPGEPPAVNPAPDAPANVSPEPVTDYTRQLDSILNDYGLSEPAKPAQTAKPRLFEQPDSHERVSRTRQAHPSGVPVKVNVGDLLQANALTEESLSDRVMQSQAIGMTPDEAKAFKDTLASNGRGLPFKLGDAKLIDQLGKHVDTQGNITLRLSPDSLVTYQDYLASIRERAQRDADNYGAMTGTIGKRGPFITETVNINASDPNSVFERQERRIDSNRVLVTYKTNHMTGQGADAASSASPNAGYEEKEISELGAGDANKQVVLPVRAAGLLAALDKGQITKSQFLDDLRYRMMSELGFDEDAIENYRNQTGEDPIKSFADQSVVARKGSKAKAFEGTSADAIIAQVRKNGGIFDFRLAVPYFQHFRKFLAGDTPDLLPKSPKSNDVFDPTSVSQISMMLSMTTGMDMQKAQDTTLSGLTAMANFGHGMLSTATGSIKGMGLIGESLFTENAPSTWLQKKGTQLGDWATEHHYSDPRYENFWTKDVMQGAGSMSTFMIAGLGGTTAGMPQWLMSATVGAFSQASEVYDDAIQMGYNHEQAISLAKWGGLIGTSEALGMGRILDKIPAHGFFAKMVAVLGEMLEEGAQEFGQNVATNILFDKNPIDADAVRAGAVGALLGFAGGAAHEIIGGEAHHEHPKEGPPSPIPNISREQYEEFVDRLSQATGYPREAIPGLIEQEVLRVNQKRSPTPSSDTAQTSEPLAPTDAQPDTGENTALDESVLPTQSKPRPDNLHYVQSPDGRVGVIQMGKDGRAQFSEITNEKSKRKALAGENLVLTAEEFDGLFPENPEGYQPGTVELGRLQFLRDEGLIHPSVMAAVQSGGAVAAESAAPNTPTAQGVVQNVQTDETSQATPQLTEENDRPESTISAEGEAVQATAAGETVQAPVRSAVDEALYQKARGLVTKTRMVSPSLLKQKLGVTHADAVSLIDRLVDEGVVTRDEQGKLRVPKPGQAAATVQAPVRTQAVTTAAGSENISPAPEPQTNGEIQATPEETPPEPAPKGWQEIEGNQPQDKYTASRILWKRKEGKAGRLYINTAAHEIIAEVYERASGQKSLRFNGLATKAENIMRMASTAQMMSAESEGTRKPALAEIAKVLRQAANDEVQVVMVNSWDKVSMRMRSTIRHEETHSTQRLLERATGRMPADEQMRALPHMDVISKGLFKRSYPKDLTVVTLEAAAHIAAGEESLIGITREQGIDFMHGYFQLIKETYGERALDEFNHLISTYKEVRDRVGGSEESTAAGITGGDVQEVGRGEAGGEEGHAEKGTEQGVAEERQEEEDPDVAEARAIQEQLQREREQTTKATTVAPPAHPPKKATKPRAPRLKKETQQKPQSASPPAIAADDEINSLLDQLQRIKSKQGDFSLADFSVSDEPGLDELVVMVKLMRAYAQRGVTDFKEATNLFQQHYAARGNPRAFDRALEIGWERLAAKPEWKGKLTTAGRVADVLKNEEPADYEAAAVSLGDTAKAATAKGTVVDVRYVAIEADDLIASHDLGLNPNPEYPSEGQPRDRTRAAYVAQIEQIKNGLRPFELGASPKASDGSPIVGPDLIVESGNGRTIAIKRAYSEDHAKSAEYKQWLIDHAKDFGLDPSKVEQASHPILVRVRLTDVDRAQFAREANIDDKAQMSATEQAAVDAKQLTPEMMASFFPSDTGEIITAANRPFIKTFLEQVVGHGEQNRLIGEDGQLTQDGVNRIRNAVFAKAYGDTEEGMTALRKLAESTDNNVRNITVAMLHQASRFARLKEDIRQGARYDLDATADIASAMQKLSSLRENGSTVDQYLRQRNMFGDDLTPFQKRILQVFDDNKRSAKAIDTILDNYLRGVELAGDPRQQQFFTTEKPQKEALFEAAYEEAINGRGQQTSLFGETSQEQPVTRADAQDQELQTGQETNQPVQRVATGQETQTGNGQIEPVVDNTQQGVSDAERSSTNLEPDSEARNAEPVREAVLPSEPGRVDGRDAAGSRPAEAADQTVQDEAEPDFVRRARERLRQQLAGNQLNANPVQAFKDTAIVTGYDVYKRSKDFTVWSGEMIRRLGDRVRPYLKDLFAEMGSFGPRQVIARLGSARLVSDRMVYEALSGERPEYLDEIARFISEQRQKVRQGSLTLRDVAKAYYMTVASQGASAIRATTFQAKMKQAGIRVDIPDEYYRVSKTGQKMIRPEEAAGAWLMTPHGQRALSDLERGVYNEELWHEGARVREAFGDDRFAKNNVLGTPAAGSFNMRNVATAVARMNEARDDSEQLGKAARKLNGIGIGKNGFIKHLLGFGDVATIDAVEINFWLTGEGKIGNLKTRQAELARAIKDFTGSPKVSQAIKDRIIQRFNAIRATGLIAPDLSDDVFNHILHQWIWDKAKGEVNNARAMYEAMRENEFVARSRARLRRSLTGQQMNMNPVLALYDEAVVLGSELYKGAKDFASWSKRMVAALSERVKPYLKNIHKRLIEFHKDERGFIQLGLLTGQGLKPAGKPKQKLTVMQQVVDIANVPHALMASGDMSAPLRQGFVLGTTEPRAFYHATIAMMTKSWKAAQYDDAVKALASRPLYRLARRAGLDLTRMGGKLSQHEEAFMSRIAGKLPWVAISERAYTLFLNTLRMDVYEKYAKQFIRDGKTWKNAEKDFRDVARFINAATGRGDLGALGKSMGPALNAVFFSPRLVKSRVDLLNPVFYMKMTPAARRIAARKMMGFTALMSMTIGLAALAGASTSFNPDDPDFLKLKIGSTHYDVLAGFQQVIRFAYRFTRGLYNNFTGTKNKWGENPDQLLGQFVRQKLAPGPSYAADAITGKTFDHKPFKPVAGIVERMVPILMKDLVEGYKAEGGLGVLKATPSFFGMGVQTYKDERPQANKIPELKRLDIQLGKPHRRDGESDEVFNARSAEQDQIISQRIEDLLKTEVYKSLDDGLRKKVLKELVEQARRDHTMTTIYERATAPHEIAAFKEEARATKFKVLDQLEKIEEYKRLRPFQQEWVKNQVREMIEVPKMEFTEEVAPQREAMKEVIKYITPAMKDFIEAARHLEPQRKAA